ncbi:universal stress protein [Rapidithrix thailandica]|uniref:Universal stress protein n=1 Tax=Rapidithrix thailandica TaxID=413964 RepID=A0AAW9RTA0_9BACT
MKKILVPTDFSDLSVAACHFCTRLLEDQCELHLLHVVPESVILDEAGNYVSDVEVDRGRKSLEEFVTEHQIEAIQDVQYGEFDDMIKQYVSQHQIDLIVMGTHGAKGLKEVFLGSHAEKIVRHSKVPVITLKEELPEHGIRNILLVSDFDKDRYADISAVSWLKEQLGGQLQLLSINVSKDEDYEYYINVKMERFCKNHNLGDDVVIHIFTYPSIKEGIIKFAKEHEIDMVAIGTHGRTGIERWLQGSVAEKMVNHIPLPVMTFKIAD